VRVTAMAMIVAVPVRVYGCMSVVVCVTRGRRVRSGVVVAVRMLSMLVPEPLRPMERHENHAERVQRRDKNTTQHAPIRVRCAPPMRLPYRLDDRILRVEPRE